MAEETEEKSLNFHEMELDDRILKVNIINLLPVHIIYI